MDQGLLYVDGSLNCRLGGHGAVIVSGNADIELAERAELLILVEGNLRLTGGGADCAIVVACSGKLEVEALTARGALAGDSLDIRNSELRFDEDMTRGSIPLGTARRVVLTYCDRDGELTENDRRMEVLLDTGTFTMHDPEFTVTRYATTPEQAMREVKDILNLDPHMNEKKWKKLGFQKKWLESFQSLAGDESRRAHLDYSLAEWATVPQ